jgi:hypothetical protein
LPSPGISAEAGPEGNPAGSPAGGAGKILLGNSRNAVAIAYERRLLGHVFPADRQPQRQNKKVIMASKKKVTAKTAVKFKDLGSKKNPKGGSSLKIKAGWAT